jgi:hypothetical protein
MMLVDHGTEVQARMGERMQEAQRQRLAARAGTAKAGHRWRLRQAAGFGLVRTGLWLLDARRA